MKLKLDTKTVSTLTLAKGRSEDFAWDTELENFGLRLRRKAEGVRRTYVVQYRLHGRGRRHTLGTVERLTLAQAREAARKILAKITLGGTDPQTEKDAKRVAASRSFARAVELYLGAKTAQLRPATLRGMRLYLTGSYFRPLHHAPVSAITRADVAVRLSAITKDHSPITAAAARDVLSSFFVWLMREGWLESNPVVATNRPITGPPRDRVLTNNELVLVWKNAGSDDFGNIIRLLILTGCRRAEVGDMAWSELDMATGVFTVPPARSKNRRPHLVVLPPLALKILAAIPRNGRDYLFGQRGAGGYRTWSLGKASLDRRLGDGVGKWALHDLRRTFATRLGDLEVEPHVVEVLLNHHGGFREGVAGTYNRSGYARAAKAAMLRWNDHLLALIEGRKSNIVSLHA